MQIRKIKNDEVNSGTNDCILIFDFTKNLYKDLVILFPNFKPKDKKVGQLHIDFATIVKLCDNIIGSGKYTQKLNISSKKVSWRFLNSLEAGIGTKKKSSIILEKGFAGFDDIIVGWRVIKSKNYS